MFGFGVILDVGVWSGCGGKGLGFGGSAVWDGIEGPKL